MSWASTDPGGSEAGYVDQVRASVAAMADIVREEGPGAPVEACPGWSVADVVGHLGDVHRWATEIVRTGEACDREWTPPAAPVELLAWFESGAATLCDLLEEVDPERPCWTFDRPPARAGFWSRRQAFEAAVHHFDVARATATPFDLEATMAARGVTEVVTFMFPREVALGRSAPLELPVRLRATDTGDTWILASEDRPGEARAEVAGPAVSLLLALWGRPADQVTRTGEAASLAALDSVRLTP